jgi:hypothetical protein
LPRYAYSILSDRKQAGTMERLCNTGLRDAITLINTMSTETEVYYAIKSARSEGKDIEDFLRIVEENWKLILDEERERISDYFQPDKPKLLT